MRALALPLRRLATREADQASRHVNSSRSFSVNRSLKDFVSGSSGPCATGDVYLPRLLLAQDKVSVAHVGCIAKGFDSASTDTRPSCRQLLGALRQSFPSVPKQFAYCPSPSAYCPSPITAARPRGLLCNLRGAHGERSKRALRPREV